MHILSSFRLSLILLYLLVLQFGIRADEQKQTFLFHFCSSTTKFYPDGPYQTNLNKLFGYLSYQAPPTGFGWGSIGESPNRVSGLALCRGDASAATCKDCIAQASGEIVNRCPNNKGAVIFYDNCLLKYSDTEFFGQIDYQNRFYMWNLRNVSDPTTFNERTKELLSQLATKAYVNPRYYATEETELDGSTKLYGLTQCSRDLAPGVCKKCLDGIIGELHSCCDGKEGGRVVGPSCNFRYEIYPFVSA